MSSKENNKRQRKADKELGNKYDKVFKQVFIGFLPYLSRRIFGSAVVASQDIETKTQTTIEREADIIKKVTLQNGETFIMHVEFQSENNKHMIYRIKEYNAYIQSKYKMEIRHLVVYTGQPKPTMASKLKEKPVFNGFELLDIRNISVEELLEQNEQESLVMAMLASYGTRNPKEVFRAILEKAQRVVDDKVAMKEFREQLQLFAQIRNLDEELKEVFEEMPINIETIAEFLDITTEQVSQIVKQA